MAAAESEPHVFNGKRRIASHKAVELQDKVCRIVREYPAREYKLCTAAGIVSKNSAAVTGRFLAYISR